MASSVSHVRLPRQAAPFLAGKFESTNVADPARPTQCLISPINGKELAVVSHATPTDIDQAVKSAREALREGQPWSRVNGKGRRDRLLQIADIVTKHADELAALESANVGKPIGEARKEMGNVAECFRWFAGCADRLHGRVMLTEDPSQVQQYTLREPAGVCAVIASFNYPLLLAAWKLAPALAAGNAVLVKPAIQTPLTVMLLAELISDILPPGVLSVLPGGPDVGQILTHHAGVDRCSFTGSPGVGRLVLHASADSNLKRCTLELGGKSPLLVFADADLDRVTEDLFGAAFSNTGQNCCAGSRILIEASAYSEVVERLVKRVSQARLGVGEQDEIGPLIDYNQFVKVRGHIRRAKANGEGQLLVGGLGEENDEAAAANGYLGVQPTIFQNVPDDSQLAREEIFGPVTAILHPFHTFDEAIDRANATEYGLAAGVWTRSIKTATQATRRLRAGTVWVNSYNGIYAHMPFGGIGLSGFGKDLGEEALDEFTNIKAVNLCMS